MNILFFITPKSEVAYIYDDYTMRQALEKMEYHRYSAIPIINRNGEYVGLDLIACALCDVPSINDLEVLASLGISVEDFKNTFISGFVMVHPMYRGNSLQLKLLDLRIDIAKSQRKKYIVTVAAVDNIHSINNIVSRGFKFKTQQENEYGILRKIFTKDLFPSDVNENIIDEDIMQVII